MHEEEQVATNLIDVGAKSATPVAMQSTDIATQAVVTTSVQTTIQTTEPTTSPSPIIILKNLRKSYQKVRKNDQIIEKSANEKSDEEKFSLDIPHLEIPAYQISGLFGSSGSGKSTLLHILMTLDSADQGEYQLHDPQNRETFLIENSYITQSKNNKKIKVSKSTVRRKLGFVFQVPFMLVNFPVQYNLSLPLIIQGMDQKEIQTQVDAMIQAIGLQSRHKICTADQLSGGERTRVAVGRALIHRPILVAADEPTGSLDVRNAKKIMDLLIEVCKKAGTTLLLVTHDPAIAMAYCDRIYGIQNGKIVFQKNKNEITKENLVNFIEKDTIP